jgi:prepilin-type N-terminal cleavage/methylation domain-containing protein
MKKNTTQSGFTLIEVMVSVAIFSIIVTIGIGSLLSVNTAHKKALASKTALDSVNFVMESIAKSIRTGDYYSCSDYGSASSAIDNFVLSNADGGCSLSGDPSIYFNDSERGGRTRYVFNSSESKIDRYRFEDTGTSWVGPQSITGGDVTVDRFEFVVVGNALDDNLQPRVTIRATFSVRVGSQNEIISMQTTVTQRSLDASPAQQGQGTQNALQLQGGQGSFNTTSSTGTTTQTRNELNSSDATIQGTNTEMGTPINSSETRN